jgi:hypothetical protein
MNPNNGKDMTFEEYDMGICVALGFDKVVGANEVFKKIPEFRSYKEKYEASNPLFDTLMEKLMLVEEPVSAEVDESILSEVKSE